MEISLTDLKRQCYADSYTDDDDILQQKLEIAEAIVVLWTNRTADELKAINDDGTTYPAPVVQAIYLLAAHYYATREAASSAKQEAVPYGIEALIKPYRRLSSTPSADDKRTYLLA